MAPDHHTGVNNVPAGEGKTPLVVEKGAVTADNSVDNNRRNSNRLNFVTERDIDDTTIFYNSHKEGVKPIDANGLKRLNRKNFWFLLTQTWWVAFLIHLDKSTLSQASTMGLFDDVKISKNEYNDLFVLFYTGYLVALWPGAAISQRVGHKHFITVSLVLWALLLGMHPLVKTGKQMMALRFLLGMVRIGLNFLGGMLILKIKDRVADRPVDYCPSSGIFPAQEKSLGPAPLVGIWWPRQRPPHHGSLQAYPRRYSRNTYWWSEVVEVATHHLRYSYVPRGNFPNCLSTQFSRGCEVVDDRGKDSHHQPDPRNTLGNIQLDLQVVPGQGVFSRPQELAFYVSISQ